MRIIIYMDAISVVLLHFLSFEVTLSSSTRRWTLENGVACSQGHSSELQYDLVLCGVPIGAYTTLTAPMLKSCKLASLHSFTL